jgi:hypothetical protein
MDDPQIRQMGQIVREEEESHAKSVKKNSLLAFLASLSELCVRLFFLNLLNLPNLRITPLRTPAGP